MEYINLPDLKGLAALRAVVELGGVEPAGKFLHIGQPAITKRLRSLDESYGTPLMQRRGRKLELTTAGKKVYAFASLALDHQSTLIEDLRDLRHGKNQLRLEATYAIGEHLLPDLLWLFSDKYPEYHLQSRMGYSRHIQIRLATGLSDIALIEQAPDHPEILVQKWFEDELILVCSANHQLSQHNNIPALELTRYNFVLRESQSSMRLILDQKLKEAGIIKLPVSFEVGSTDTIVEILSRGQHLSFLPRFAVTEALQNNTLHHIKVDLLKIKMILWIARNRASINNPVAEAFIQSLRMQ